MNMGLLKSSGSLIFLQVFTFQNVGTHLAIIVIGVKLYSCSLLIFWHDQRECNHSRMVSITFSYISASTLGKEPVTK